MILQEGQGRLDIEQAIKWLRDERGKGAHIDVRPPRGCMPSVSSMTLVRKISMTLVRKISIGSRLGGSSRR
jgi:hypothetical protein